jgi:hypothetical protein
LIGALADVFGYDIGDQKVHIGRTPINDIMQLRSLCPGVSCAVDRLSASAILLFGECNYLAWNDSVEYRKTFAKLKIFYIPKAGHYIQFEQPELMNKVLRSFLLDQPDAFAPYTGDADPRPPAN